MESDKIMEENTNIPPPPSGEIVMPKSIPAPPSGDIVMPETEKKNLESASQEVSSNGLPTVSEPLQESGGKAEYTWSKGLKTDLIQPSQADLQKAIVEPEVYRADQTSKLKNTAVKKQDEVSKNYTELKNEQKVVDFAVDYPEIKRLQEIEGMLTSMGKVTKPQDVKIFIDLLAKRNELLETDVVQKNIWDKAPTFEVKKPSDFDTMGEYLQYQNQVKNEFGDFDKKKKDFEQIAPKFTSTKLKDVLSTAQGAATKQQELIAKIQSDQKVADESIKAAHELNKDKLTKVGFFDGFIDGMEQTTLSNTIADLYITGNEEQLQKSLENIYSEQVVFPRETTTAGGAGQLIGGQIKPLAAGVGGAAISELTTGNPLLGIGMGSAYYGRMGIGSGLMDGYVTARSQGKTQTEAYEIAKQQGKVSGISGAVEGVMSSIPFLGKPLSKIATTPFKKAVMTGLADTGVDGVVSGAIQLGLNKNKQKLGLEVDVWDGVKEEMLAEMLLDGGANAVFYGASKLKPETYNTIITGLAKLPLADIQQKVDEAVKLGVLDAANAGRVVNDIMETSGALQSMPELNEKQEAEVLPKVKEIRQLEKQSENLTGAFKEANEVRVEELNREIHEDLGTPLSQKEQKRYDDLLERKEGKDADGKTTPLKDSEKSELKHFEKRIKAAEKKIEEAKIQADAESSKGGDGEDAKPEAETGVEAVAENGKEEVVAEVVEPVAKETKSEDSMLSEGESKLKAGSVGVGGDVEIKNEGKAEAPTKESVTEMLNINNPFYKKVEDALVKLGLIEKYNAETGTGDVVGGYAQQTSDGGFSVGKMLFSQDGSISYFDGDVIVYFDKNGNVISENTKEAKQKAVSLEIESKKASIANFEKTRDSESFKYKEVTETDVLGNKKKVKRLKTEQELKESTDKINAAIDKAKAELSNLEQPLKETTKAESNVEEGSVGVGGDVDLINKIKQVQSRIYNEDGTNKKGATKEDIELNDKLLAELEVIKNKPTETQIKEPTELDKLQEQKNELSKQKDEASKAMDNARAKVYSKDGLVKKNVRQVDAENLKNAKSDYDNISKQIESIETKQKELREQSLKETTKAGSVGVRGDVVDEKVVKSRVKRIAKSLNVDEQRSQQIHDIALKAKDYEDFKKQVGDLIGDNTVNENRVAEAYADIREEAKSEYEKELDRHLEDLREAYSDVSRTEAGLKKLQETTPSRISGFIKRLLTGTTPEDVVASKARLAEMQKQYRKEKADLRALLPRERGSNFVVEKLSKAVRNGEISQETADLAIDLIKKQPNLFEDLAISITKKSGDDGVQGWYRSADALVKIFKNPSDPTTAVHEILHHTERFLPHEIRDNIIKEWNKEVELQKADLAKKLKNETDVGKRQEITTGLLYLELAQARQTEPNATNVKAMEGIMSKYLGDHTDSQGNFHKGLGNSWYQLYNPSEWWAVNASRLFREAKNKPELKTWVDKAKAFYNYLIESAKKIFKGSPTEAVEKGLKAVLNGETLEDRQGSQMATSKKLLNIKQKGTFDERLKSIYDEINKKDESKSTEVAKEETPKDYQVTTEPTTMPDGEPAVKVTITKPNGEKVDLGAMYPEDVEKEVANKIKGYKLQESKAGKPEEVKAEIVKKEIGEEIAFKHAGQEVTGKIVSIDGNGNYKVTEKDGTKYTVEPENARTPATMEQAKKSLADNMKKLQELSAPKKKDNTPPPVMNAIVPTDVITAPFKLLGMGDKLISNITSKMEDGIANSFRQAMASSNKYLSRGSSEMQGIFKQLALSQEDIEVRRRALGQMNSAPLKAVQFYKNGVDIVGKTPESLQYVHQVLDPEVYTERGMAVKTEADLSPAEKNLYDLLRSTNDMIHDWHYVNGRISEEVYLKNKGTYAPRFYDNIEFEGLPNELKEAFEDYAKQQNYSYIKERKNFEDVMGENTVTEDPVYGTSMRLAQMLRNQAMMDYADVISSKVKTYKEGDADIPNSYIKLDAEPYAKLVGDKLIYVTPNIYGKLTNKYVPRDVAEDFKGATFINAAMDNVYSAFKWYNRLGVRRLLNKTKTIYNPITQLGNIGSNYVFAMMNGIDPLTYQHRKFEAAREVANKGDLYVKLVEEGVLGTDVITKDLKLEAKGVTKEKGILGKIDDKITDFYSSRDDIAKVAAYLAHTKDYGRSEADALKRIGEGFQNYNNVGRFYDFASKTPVVGNPFVKFKGDLMRIMKNNFSQRPLTNIALLTGLNVIASAFSNWSGEDEDVRKARESRPFIPKVPLPNALGGDIPLVWQTPYGEVNAARYFSPFNIYDMGDKGSTVEEVTQFLPYQATPEKPFTKFPDPFLGVYFQVAFDKDFRGQPILDPEANKWREGNATTEEKIQNAATFISRQQIPFYAGSNDMLRAYNGEPDYYGRNKDLKQALLSNIIKIEQKGKPEVVSDLKKEIDSKMYALDKLNKEIVSAKNLSEKNIAKIKAQNNPNEQALIEREYKRAENKIAELMDEQAEIKTELIDPEQMLSKLGGKYESPLNKKKRKSAWKKW